MPHLNLPSRKYIFNNTSFSLFCLLYFIRKEQKQKQRNNQKNILSRKSHKFPITIWNNAFLVQGLFVVFVWFVLFILFKTSFGYLKVKGNGNKKPFTAIRKVNQKNFAAKKQKHRLGRKIPCLCGEV